jgi:hypothetical protein
MHTSQTSGHRQLQAQSRTIAVLHRRLLHCSARHGAAKSSHTAYVAFSHLLAPEIGRLVDRVSPQGLCEGLIRQLARQCLDTLETLALDDVRQLVTAHGRAACIHGHSSRNSNDGR